MEINNEIPVIGKTEAEMIIQPPITCSYQKICEIFGPMSGKDAKEWLEDKKLIITTPVPLMELIYLIQNAKEVIVRCQN